VGQQAALRFAPVASDVPERSSGGSPRWQLIPAPHGRINAASCALAADPEPIETVALLPDQTSGVFTCVASGTASSCRRPERVFGEWWKRDAESKTVRDYFQAKTAPASASGSIAQQRRDVTTARILVSTRNFWMTGARYVELQCTSHFSFLRAPVSLAMSCSIKQLSSHRSACDRRPQFLAGIVRAHEPPHGRRAADRGVPPRS